MKIKQLRELAQSKRDSAREKALSAQVAFEAEEPDFEAGNALLKEAKSLAVEAQTYADRADSMEEAMTLAEPEPEAKAKSTGLVVVEDEADKAIKAKPFTSFGEFLMAVKNAALNVTDERLPSLVSNDAMDEGGFSLNKALGDQFVGGLVKSAYAKQTGLNEGIGSQGGFLVGTDRGGELMQRVYNVGDILQRTDMVGVSANSNGMSFYGINETSRANGSRRGGIRAYWAAEGGAKTASQPEWREIDLKLKKVVGLVYATDELLQDANALETWIMNNLPEELRFVVEDAIINGTGGGMPQGIVGSGAVVSVPKENAQAADTIVSQNVIKMWSRMWAPSRRTAVWLVNQDCEPQLMQMSIGVGTGGQLVYMPPGGLSGSPYGSLFTRPVIPSEYANTVGSLGDIMLIDFNEYQMIEKGGVQSASSIHVRFVYDESVFRFVYRCDGQPKWNSPLTPFKGTNTLSPFITLAARD